MNDDNVLIIIGSREESTMASSWDTYLCLKNGDSKKYRIFEGMYEVLRLEGEYEEFFDEEDGDYIFPDIIDGKEFVEMNSDRMLMGGNLSWSNPYETVEFDSVDDANLIKWLESNSWSEKLDAIKNNLGNIIKPQS